MMQRSNGHSRGFLGTRALTVFSLLVLNSFLLAPAAADILYRETPSTKHIENGGNWYLEGNPETHVKYIGEVENGVPHGQGSESDPDGGRYIGGYKDGKYHGQGTFTWSDGGRYVGEWKDDKPNGQGTFTFDGSEYVGQYRDGGLNGQGTWTAPDGSKYVGEWKDDLFHGQGTFTFADGRKYVGEFKDDKYHGQGIFTWPDGGRYVGEWRGGKKNGQGTYTFANGSKYAGEYKDDEYHGQGGYTHSDGSTYVGEFKDSKQNGQGTWTWPDGSKYVGEWRGGKKNGQGTHTFADGSKYVGEWRWDKQNGHGTYTNVNGNEYVGEFKGDKKHGKGALTFPDGSKYVGGFKNGSYGDGTRYNAQGESIVSISNGKARDLLGLSDETKERQHIGRFCEEGNDGVLLLNNHLIFRHDEGYLGSRITKYIESDNRVVITTEDFGLYELYFDQALISEPLDGYTPMQVSPCKRSDLTPEYFLLETDVIELDNMLWKTAATCHQEGISACLLIAFESQDVSDNGKLSIAELNRFFRHLITWIGMTNDGSIPQLIGTAAGTQFAGPLFTKLIILNYDYDNDDHLSLSEILHDFADLGSVAITKEEIRERLKMLDGVQQLRSLDLGNLESLLKLLQ